MQLAWSSGTRLGPGHRNTMKRRTKQCHTQMSRMILLQYSRPLNDRKGVYFLSWTPSCSSFGKIRMSLFTGLLRVVACVFTTAGLTRPWPFGSTCKTRANDQKLRGTFSSRISTISPSTRFRWGFCHLLLSCITTRYSFFDRDENKFAHIILLKLSWWGQYHSGLGCQDVVRGKWLEITWLARGCRQGSWMNNCVHFTHECSERFLIQAVAIFFH